MVNCRRHFYDFGSFRLIENEGILLRDGSPVPLTPKAFDTLRVLVQNSLRVVSKEDLMGAVWPDSAVEENNLTQQISLLRKTFADVESRQQYIETIPKRGYRFMVAAKEGWGAPQPPDSVPDSPIEAAETISTADQVPNPAVIRPHRRTRAALRWGIITLALVILSFAAIFGIRRFETSRAAHQIPQPRRSLAILGFKNMTGDPQAAWLSSGFAEMFRTELAAGRGLRIIPAENVARMQRELGVDNADTLSVETLARIRKNIGADLVLSGSYTTLGNGPQDQFRIDVRVQDAVTGEISSSEMGTGSRSRLFDTVSKSAGVLRQNLGLTQPGASDLRVSRESFPQQPEVQRLYAEGVSKLRLLDAAGAVPLLQTAADRDGHSPLIRSALAEALSMLGYKRRAASEAKTAFELAKDFPPEKLIEIEGPYRELTYQWDRALDIYKSLWTVFSDNIEYGLQLAKDEIEAGRAKEAKATIARLRKIPGIANDPRIELTEAAADEALGDFKREYTAAVQAAASANAVGARLLMANALLRQCWALNSTGDRRQALAVARQAKDIFADAVDSGGEARAVKNIGDVLDDGGQHAEGLHSYDVALGMFRKIDNETGIAVTLNNMAHAMRNEGNLAGARKNFDEALGISRRVGDDARTALALNGLAILMWRQQGNLPGAQKMYEQALKIHVQQNDKARAATVLGNLAIVLQDQGHLVEAKKRFEESLTTQRELDDRPGMARTFGNLGELLRDMGDLAGAKKNFLEHLRIAGGMADAKQRGYALFGLGEVLMLEGDLNGSLAKHSEALKLRTDSNEQGLAAESRAAIGETLIELGNGSEAAVQLGGAITEFHHEKEDDEEAEAQTLLARAYLLDHKNREALKILNAVTPRIAKIEDISLRLATTITAGMDRARLGDRAAATSLLQSAQAEAAKSGYRAHQFDAQLALADIDEDKSSRAARLHSIQEEAKAAGFGLIAWKAAAYLTNDGILGR